MAQWWTCTKQAALSHAISLREKASRNIPEHLRSELHTRTPEGLAEKSAAHGLAGSTDCGGRHLPSSEPSALAQVSTDDFPCRKCCDLAAHNVDKIGDVEDGNAVMAAAEHGNATSLPGKPQRILDGVTGCVQADAITCSRHGCRAAWSLMSSISCRKKGQSPTSVTGRRTPQRYKPPVLSSHRRLCRSNRRRACGAERECHLPSGQARVRMVAKDAVTCMRHRCTTARSSNFC